MSTGILLAAGRGRRFGGEKLLARLPDGRHVAEAAAAPMVAALPRVLAVVRPGAEELAGVLRAAGCDIEICAAADHGMGASLACGIRATPGGAGWVVALADMPWLRVETVALVAAELERGAELVAPVHHGTRGHPVAFGPGFRDALSRLDADRGARELLAARRDRLVAVAVDDPGVLADIDTRADLEPPGGA